MTTATELELKKHFGQGASVSVLTTGGRMGRRIHGVDLSGPLSADQARALVSLLDDHQILTFNGQDRFGFDPSSLERLANHFGAPVPHPSNVVNYGSGQELELPAPDRRAATRNNQAFPGVVECLPGAESPAVYIVSNLAGSGPDAKIEVGGGQHWHTDIEFEPIPLSTSMFYVHRIPTTRDAPGDTWVTNPGHEEGFYHPGSPNDLAERRAALPLNGETAYADTVAAYAALPDREREQLGRVMVRRRLRRDDDGFLIPLVHTNPRTGTKALHSPIWASRGSRVAPVEVDGLDEEASRHFLDRLEAHCLRPEFRYDHIHAVGDITIWDNFSTLHVAPPLKRIINDPDDSRLMYRISCKGEPSYQLPRIDSEAWIDHNIVPPYRSPHQAEPQPVDPNPDPAWSDTGLCPPGGQESLDPL